MENVVDKLTLIVMMVIVFRLFSRCLSEGQPSGFLIIISILGISVICAFFTKTSYDS